MLNKLAVHKRLDAIPKENVKTFSQTFHDQMAPLVVEPDDDPSESWSKYISATRSEERKKFCEAVSSATIATTTKLSEDTEWLDIFSYVDDSGARVEKYVCFVLLPSCGSIANRYITVVPYSVL